MKRRTFLGCCIASVVGILCEAIGIEAKPKTLGFDPGSTEGDTHIDAWMGPGWYAEIVKVRDTFTTREFRARVLTFKCGPLGTKHALHIILEPGAEGHVRAALNSMAQHLQRKDAKGVAWARWLVQNDCFVRRLFGTLVDVLDHGLQRVETRESYLQSIDEMITTPVGCELVNRWVVTQSPLSGGWPYLTPETAARHQCAERIRNFLDIEA